MKNKEVVAVVALVMEIAGNQGLGMHQQMVGESRQQVEEHARALERDLNDIYQQKENLKEIIKTAAVGHRLSIAMNKGEGLSWELLEWIVEHGRITGTTSVGQLVTVKVESEGGPDWRIVFSAEPGGRVTLVTVGGGMNKEWIESKKRVLSVPLAFPLQSEPKPESESEIEVRSGTMFNPDPQSESECVAEYGRGPAVGLQQALYTFEDFVNQFPDQ